MSKKDETQKAAPSTAGGRGSDDRRSSVNPNDKPVPQSPEPDQDAVRAGEEKLEQVKAY